MEEPAWVWVTVTFEEALARSTLLDLTSGGI